MNTNQAAISQYPPLSGGISVNGAVGGGASSTAQYSTSTTSQYGQTLGQSMVAAKQLSSHGGQQSYTSGQQQYSQSYPSGQQQFSQTYPSGQSQYSQSTTTQQYSSPQYTTTYGPQSQVASYSSPQYTTTTTTREYGQGAGVRTGVAGEGAIRSVSSAYTASYNMPTQQQTYSTTTAGMPAQQQTYSTTTAGMPAQQQQQTYSTTTTSMPAQQQTYSTTTTGIPAQQQTYSTTTTGIPAQQQTYSTTTTGMRNATGQDATLERSLSQVRVVGHEYGQERVISIQQRVDESRTQIISEHYVEHEVKVPKKITREDIIEKVVVIPERVLNEEIIEEIATVKEKIIEIARPIIVEKIIEVPEYEYVERIVEVPEKIVQEKRREVEVVDYRENIIERKVQMEVPRKVDVEEIKYREIPFEVVVEVPEYREELVITEVPVTQYVDKAVPQLVQSEVAIDIDRQIPVPVEANVVYEYRLPKIRPRYNKITYPVYLPRFIEIPVAVELLNSGLIAQADAYLQQIGVLPKTAASLCEIENLATTIMKADLQSQISNVDLQSAVLKAWQEGTLQVQSMSGVVGGTVGGYSTSTKTTTTTTQQQISPSYVSPSLRVVA